MLAPAPGSAGVTVVVCTSNGLQTVLIDSRGLPASTGQKSTTKPCDFASLGFAALAGVAPPRLAAAVRYAAVEYRVMREAPRRTPKPIAVSARGPPAV